MILYHATTPAKVRRYHETGCILAPVRGWDTLTAALAWAARTGRSVVLRIDSADANAYPLPDHRSPLGRAHWIDSDVPEWECMVSPERVHAAAAMQAREVRHSAVRAALRAAMCDASEAKGGGRG